jgi:tol-pal system protein YbgF
MSLRRRLAASLLTLQWLVPLGSALPVLMVRPAAAQQDYDRPPAGFGDDGRSGYGYGNGGSAPVDAPDPAGLAVRIGRLESRVREMTGQIEELQNANHKLTEQLQHAPETAVATPPRGKRSDAAAPSVIAGENGPAMDADGAPPRSTSRKSRDDAFDPDTAPGDAPGKPKPLGSVASTTPTDNDGDQPMDLAGGKLRRSDGPPDTALAPTLRLPPATPKAGGATAPEGTAVADATPETPRAAFDVALGYYRDKQYDNAEKSFTAFIQKNPKNRLVADATYYLGESFAQRGRSREAAEQYLKISTDYANSTRAPDAMLHLAMSLKALGAKEQACATFSEVNRKYPNAPAYVRSGAEREAKRAQC